MRGVARLTQVMGVTKVTRVTGDIWSMEVKKEKKEILAR